MIELLLFSSYLADMLGSTRETVSMCVSSFEKKGMIKAFGKKIIVRDPKELYIYFIGK